jgi:hypothetical protein
MAGLSSPVADKRGPSRHSQKLLNAMRARAGVAPAETPRAAPPRPTRPVTQAPMAALVKAVGGKLAAAQAADKSFEAELSAHEQRIIALEEACNALSARIQAFEDAVAAHAAGAEESA